MKKIVIFLIAISLSWTAYYRTEGFTIGKIAPALPAKSVSKADSQIKEILSQPFTYLGKGRQSFVFVSCDGNYVLKFFNQSYFNMPFYSFLFYEKEKAKREKRRAFFENSYEIAFHEFNEEILYLHMGLSNDLPIVHFKGPASSNFQVDLNATSFVLQKKGEPFYERLKVIFEKEGIEGLVCEIKKFKEQIAMRISKQIADGDSDVEHNWGYVNRKIFHLDPGRLYYDPSLIDPKRQKEEWHTATHRFIKWLGENYPEAVKYLENQALQ